MATFTGLTQIEIVLGKPRWEGNPTTIQAQRCSYRQISVQNAIKIEIKQEENSLCRYDNYFCSNLSREKTGNFIAPLQKSTNEDAPEKILKQISKSESESENEEESYHSTSKKKPVRGVNETKNVAKNYGKSIINFIISNKQLTKDVCRQCNVSYHKFLEDVPKIKKGLVTIAELRKAWTTYKYAKCMRILSEVFLRKRSLSYIFNSRVSNVQHHVKYRNRFREVIRRPQNFDHIKNY